MKDFKIYLISGKARHGKTTLGDYIKEYYEQKGKKCILTSYAKYIKMYAMELTDWDGNEETKPRDILQKLGTDVIRQKLGKEEFFVKRLEEDMDIYREFADAVVISDARIPIEIDYFKEKKDLNTTSILIKRPDFENHLSDDQKRHNTETALDKYDSYDYTIVNDDSLESLKEKIFEYLEGIEL